MANATRNGIRMASDGTMPLENAITDAMRDPRIAVLLMGLRNPQGASSGGGQKRKGFPPASAASTAHSSENAWYNNQNQAKANKGNAEAQRLAAKVRALEGQLKNQRSGGGKKGGNNGGIGGGKGGARPPQRSAYGAPAKGHQGKGKAPGYMPPGLEGCNAVRFSDGRRVCFNYNLGGCTEATPGQQCRRGWHICPVPGCDKDHSRHEH